MTPTADPAEVELLDWDSRFFGIRIARLQSDRLTPEILERALEWCARHLVECLYLQTAATDPDTIRLAERNRFHAVDQRLVLDWEPGGDPSTKVSAVRSWRPEDIPQLKEIAAESHRDSRFYFDRRFSRERCHALYETWIEQSCLGYAQQVLVGERNDRPAGYVTCHVSGDKSGSIGLMAVAASAQGHGLGRELVNAALGWFVSQGVTQVRVVTQGRNIAGQRLYQACGFRSSAFYLWYHWWSAEG